ncbi:MAG: site-specific integrase [Pseudomonadales bacterium]|nr:site-specific integrase [Pseudomonadales bacterium]
MGIHKRGKTWYSQFQIKGKTYIQSTKTTNKTLAKEFDRKFRNEVYNREYLGEREKIQLTDALDQYLKTKKDTKNYKGLVSNVRTVKTYFDESLALHDLTTAKIERFVQKRKDEGFKSMTIHHSLVVIRGSHKLAEKLGYRVVPIEWPPMKKSPGRLRYLSIEEEQRLLRELDPDKVFGNTHQHDPENLTPEKLQARIDNRDLVIALLDTGCRYSEIAQLKWSDVDTDDGTINLYRSKTNNSSILYCTDRLLITFRNRFKHRRSDEYIFTDKSGKSHRNHSTIAIRKAFDRAGLKDVRVHDLRHTAASRLVQNGLSLLEVSKILGHSTIQMTMRYAHLEQSETAKKMRDVLNKVNDQVKPKLAVVK